jgi:O-antigen ligase
MKFLEKIIEYGLYLFIFLLPWQTRLILREGNLNGYWEYGTFSIYATEILLWAIFAMAAIWWLLKKSEIRNSKSEIRNKSQIPNLKPKINSKFQIPKTKFVFLFLGFFVFWSFISIFWSESKSVALQAWIRLAEGVGLFLVLQVIRFDMVKLAWAFIISALVQAGLGGWQFFTQSTFASKWLGMAIHDPISPGTIVVETVLRRWLRAYGSLPHPNMLAGFLALAIILTVWLYQKVDYGLKKLLLPICFAILTLGLLTTFSKSVIVSLAIVALFLWIMIWLTRQDKEFKITLLKFTLIFLIITAIFSVVFWEPVSTRFYGQGRLEAKSTIERLSYFDQAKQLIKKHPVIGVGIGNYTLVVHNEINPNLQSWDYQPVHNIYLLAITELGAAGIVFVSLFFSFLFYWFLRLIKEKNFSHLVLFSIVFFIAVIGFFDHYLWTLYFGIVIFWFSIGIFYKGLI